MFLFDNPTLERVGYSQISLRERTDEPPDTEVYTGIERGLELPHAAQLLDRETGT